MKANKPLERACDAVGGVTALAARLNVDQTAVSAWKRRGIPAERVLAIERETGVSRHDLRPDLYPRENASA